jgi:AcrR family transcriptional regulator
MDHKYSFDGAKSSARLSPGIREYKAVTDPRVAKTRAALADAVLTLASEKPFADVTITEIAERAGVGYASFFRHYKDKDALLADVADTVVDDLLPAMMPAMLDEDTLTASIAMCRFIDENRLVTRALLAGGAETMVRRHIVMRAIERSGSRPTAETDRPAIPAIPHELVITHCVAASLGLLSWWLDQGAAISCEAMGEVLNRLVMAPVRGLERESPR